MQDPNVMVADTDIKEESKSFDLTGAEGVYSRTVNGEMQDPNVMVADSDIEDEIERQERRMRIAHRRCQYWTRVLRQQKLKTPEIIEIQRNKRRKKWRRQYWTRVRRIKKMKTIEKMAPETTNVDLTGAEGVDSRTVNGEMQDPNVMVADTDIEDNGKRHVSRLNSQLSARCIVRKNLPMIIMVMPRTAPTQERQQTTESQPLFLQGNGESETTPCSCDASAMVHLLTENGVLAVWKLGQERKTAEGRDSKKPSSYVGLKNQGATCYINSILQTLYFTNALRKAIYKMPTESDDSSKSVALAIQSIFIELQLNDRPVGTEKLTKLLGLQKMEQHDIQEVLRVILDKVEGDMHMTSEKGTIKKLFEGESVTFIKCININCQSNKTNTFYDIQLNIKGKKNITESFHDCITAEMLDGDNKYDAGEHGLQDAEKRTIFSKFPPVVHLQLLRFEFDPHHNCFVKFNGRFEFTEKVNLSEYLLAPEATPAAYTLHSVLVHYGDNKRGHYVVFINPKLDGKWWKFDDEVVSRCSKQEAIENNYGGLDDDMNMTGNAYMLVYVRDSELSTVLQDVTEEDIPPRLDGEGRGRSGHQHLGGQLGR